MRRSVVVSTCSVMSSLQKVSGSSLRFQWSHTCGYSPASRRGPGRSGRLLAAAVAGWRRLASVRGRWRHMRTPARQVPAICRRPVPAVAPPRWWRHVAPDPPRRQRSAATLGGTRCRGAAGIAIEEGDPARRGRTTSRGPAGPRSDPAAGRAADRALDRRPRGSSTARLEHVARWCSRGVRIRALSSLRSRRRSLTRRGACSCSSPSYSCSDRRPDQPAGPTRRSPRRPRRTRSDCGLDLDVAHGRASSRSSDSAQSTRRLPSTSGERVHQGAASPGRRGRRATPASSADRTSSQVERLRRPIDDQVDEAQTIVPQRVERLRRRSRSGGRARRRTRRGCDVPTRVDACRIGRGSSLRRAPRRRAPASAAAAADAPDRRSAVRPVKQPCVRQQELPAEQVRPPSTAADARRRTGAGSPTVHAVASTLVHAAPRGDGP